MKKLVTVNMLVWAVLLSGCDLDAPKLVRFEPAALTNCNSNAEVLVKWDVQFAYPSVQNVQVFVSDGTQETLFSEGGAVGEAKTGPWVGPANAQFILKDKSNGKVLEQAALSAPNCPK